MTLILTAIHMMSFKDLTSRKNRKNKTNNNNNNQCSRIVMHLRFNIVMPIDVYLNNAKVCKEYIRSSLELFVRLFWRQDVESQIGLSFLKTEKTKRTRLISTLKKFFGRCHRLTLPFRVSVTAVADDICGPWCCCRGCVSFLDATWGTSWRVPRAEREVLALPEHLVPPYFIAFRIYTKPEMETGYLFIY